MNPPVACIRLCALVQRTVQAMLRALALLPAADPPGRKGAAARQEGRGAAPAPRTDRRRNDTWRQLSTLNDATLRDIGMTRPALGRYLVEPRSDASVSGNASDRDPAGARTGGPPRPVQAGI